MAELSEFFRNDSCNIDNFCQLLLHLKTTCLQIILQYYTFFFSASADTLLFLYYFQAMYVVLWKSKASLMFSTCHDLLFLLGYLKNLFVLSFKEKKNNCNLGICGFRSSLQGVFYCGISCIIVLFIG